MAAWVGYMEKASKNYLWNTGFHFGDWLFYRPFDDNDGRSAITDKFLIAQAFYCYSVQNVINAAKVLGNDADVKTYSALLETLKKAFIHEYTTASGRLVSSTQTAYVLALNFDLLPEDVRAAAAKRLVDNIASYGNHLTTGFLSTGDLPDARPEQLELQLGELVGRVALLRQEAVGTHEESVECAHARIGL